MAPEVAIAMATGLDELLPGTTVLEGGVLTIHEDSRPLARIIARWFDAYEMAATGHSQAV